MAKGIGLFIVAFILALAYAAGMGVILFKLSEVSTKALEEGNRKTHFIALAAMVAFFFLGFLFAKLLFGF